MNTKIYIHRELLTKSTDELERLETEIGRELERRRRNKIMTQKPKVYKYNDPKNNLLDGPFFKKD